MPDDFESMLERREAESKARQQRIHEKMVQTRLLIARQPAELSALEQSFDELKDELCGRLERLYLAVLDLHRERAHDGRDGGSRS